MSAMKSSPKPDAPPSDELHCCLCCGRDTRSKFQICARCLRGPRTGCSRCLDDESPTAEDDYSEESGPNSVYWESEQRREREVNR